MLLSLANKTPGHRQSFSIGANETNCFSRAVASSLTGGSLPSLQWGSFLANPTSPSIRIAFFLLLWFSLWLWLFQLCPRGRPRHLHHGLGVRSHSLLLCPASSGSLRHDPRHDSLCPPRPVSFRPRFLYGSTCYGSRIGGRPMIANAPATNPFAQLLQYRGHFALHQALCAIAKFGVADAIERGLHNTSDLSRDLSLNENALYRTLRALAGQGVFEEFAPRSFRNTPLSSVLRSDVPGSLRALFIFGGCEFVARPFQEFAYSLQTGVPSRHMLSGMDSFAYLAQNPELARMFDDAMTSFSNLIGPAVA